LLKILKKSLNQKPRLKSLRSLRMMQKMTSLKSHLMK
jgi:hypothetical protein